MGNRIGTLRPEDRAAVLETAKRLQIDPYELGAVIHKESGFNPNVWGGAGGRHYGLIQFGTTERGEAGLDPKRIGSYTIREQLPNVEKWLAGRGYRPGMGVQKLYATILGGNPNANIYAKDAFGTSVANAVESFRPGGALYRRAQGTLGDAPGFQVGSPSSSGGQVDQGYQGGAGRQLGFSEDQIANALGQAVLSKLFGDVLSGKPGDGLYPGSTAPSIPHSNEADVEGSDQSGITSDELKRVLMSALAAKTAEQTETDQLKAVQSELNTYQQLQKQNMANMMRQAQAAYATPIPVF